MIRSSVKKIIRWRLKGFLLQHTFSVLEKSWEMPEMWRCCGWSDNKDFLRSVPPQLFQLCGEIHSNEKLHIGLLLVKGVSQEFSWCSIYYWWYQSDILPSGFQKVLLNSCLKSSISKTIGSKQQFAVNVVNTFYPALGKHKQWEMFKNSQRGKRGP